MNPVQVATEAARMLWKYKVLWLFGLFLAGGGSGANATPPIPGLGKGEMARGFLPLIVVGSILALLLLIGHLVSEGALIAAARNARRGEPVRARGEFKAGWSSLGRVFSLKAIVIAAIGISAIPLAGPILLVTLNWIPVWVFALGVGPLVLVGVPWILTLYLGYVYALRIAVLDDRGVWQAVREARQFLHGRLLDSIKLLGLTFLAQIATGIALGVALIPAMLVGVSLYFGVGLIPALVAAAPLALAFCVPVVGAGGAFGSLVWTFGFMDCRAELTT